MRRRFSGGQALALACIAAGAACFPDPPPDDGLLDSGIVIPDGGLTGSDATVNGLLLSTRVVDFGLNECGGVAPGTQKLTLTNTSSGQITYGAAVSGNQFALVSAATGQLAAGASIDLEISAPGVSSFASAGGVTEGALQVVTDAPGQKLFVVDLKETASGASLLMIPSTADFGRVAEGTSSGLDIGFRNNGNAPITITFDDAVTAPFTLDMDGDAGTSFTVAANSTTTLHATYSPMPGDDFSTLPIGFHTTGVLCGVGEGELPSSVILTAVHGAPNDFSITPGIATFDVGGTGYVPCGQSATSRTITVSNPIGGSGPLPITATTITGPFVVLPSVDTLADAGSEIDLALGASQTFTITPTALALPLSTAPNALGGFLSIQMFGGDVSQSITLSQTMQGAVLAFSPQSSIDFGTGAIDTPTMQLLGITNSGNAAVGVSLGITGSPYFSVSPSAQFSVNTPGGSSTVTFLPVALGPAQGTLAIQTAGPTCSLPSPSTIALTGNGVASGPDSGDDSGDDSGLDSGDAE